MAVVRVILNAIIQEARYSYHSVSDSLAQGRNAYNRAKAGFLRRRAKTGA